MKRSSRHARQRRSSSAGPIVAFLLIASLGIMFAGCSSKRQASTDAGSQAEDIVFTEEDIARFHRLAQGDASSGETMTGALTSSVPRLDMAAASASEGAAASAAPVALDLSQMPKYDSLRKTPAPGADNLYKVVNDILRVRGGPSTGAALLATLRDGDPLSVVEFTNGEWAKVKLADGTVGFVASKYIAKVVTQERLAEEEKAFAGLYYVNFAFLNVRQEANQGSPKLGEIPGRAFVHPVSIAGEWAKVPFQGKEGYVSMKYLSPFQPRFIVRQTTFELPVLVYDATATGGLENLVQHVQKLKAAGATVLTLRDFRDFLLRQDKDGALLKPKSIVLTLKGVTPENVQAISDALTGNAVRATLWVETRHVGLAGIPEKTLLTLAANRLDVQSAGHTGDDLRSLTSAQVKLELEQSRALLEQMTRQPVFAVAYPLGGVNDRVMELAAKAGYLFGVGSAPSSTVTRDQFLRMPSYGVTTGMSGDDVVKLLK